MQWMFTENIYLVIQQQLGASGLVKNSDGCTFYSERAVGFFSETMIIKQDCYQLRHVINHKTFNFQMISL